MTCATPLATRRTCHGCLSRDGTQGRTSHRHQTTGLPTVSPWSDRAEQRLAPDSLQRPLVPRSRFRQQVKASVRGYPQEN
jgi:hypothetical protein